MALSNGGAKKILLTFTAAVAAMILLSAFVFSLVVRKDIAIVRETVMRYASETALEKARAIAHAHQGKTVSLNDFSDRIREYSEGDSKILNVIIFSKTADENFCRVAAKIDIDSKVNVPIELNQRVREESEENFLKKGLTEPVTNNTLFADKSIYWHNAYIPVTLKSGNHVARFMISSSDAVIALDDYFKRSKRLGLIIIIASAILIITVLFAAFLFIRNFSLMINGITGYAKKAANGDVKMTLNENADEDITELAMSFNTLVGELREKNRQIESLREKEKEAERVAAVMPDAASKSNAKVEKLKKQLEESIAEKERIEKESQRTDEFSESFRKGVELLKSDQLTEAATIFSALTLLKPDGFGSYFNLGVVYAKKRMFDQAIEMFAKASSLNHNHPQTEAYLEKIIKMRDQNQ